MNYRVSNDCLAKLIHERSYAAEYALRERAKAAWTGKSPDDYAKAPDTYMALVELEQRRQAECSK